MTTFEVAKPKIKRLQYARDNLKHAYVACTEGGMSVYQAAKRYDVPESTLRDRTRGNVTVETSIGFDTIFSINEEANLHNHINYMANIGYGYNKQAVQTLAKDYAQSLNKPVKSNKIAGLSNCWFYGFLKRWPDLSVKTAQKLSMSRAKSASQNNIKNYYQELSTILTKNNLHNRPDRIYNIDETGVNTQHNPLKIVCSKFTKAQAVTSEKSALTTLIAAGNASGNQLPPYYIFKGKRWNNAFLEGALPGAEGEMSETGWSNSQVFHNYLTKFLIKHVNLNDKQKVPLLILFDGHKSHVNLTLTNWAKKHNVILFLLPPHTSHLTQPLDVAIFGPFKSMFYKECDTYLKNHPGINISKYEVATLTAKPYLRAMSAENLLSAFRKTGVFPFNNKAIDETDVAPSTIYKSADLDDETTVTVDAVTVDETTAETDAVTVDETTEAVDGVTVDETSTEAVDGVTVVETTGAVKEVPSSVKSFFEERTITKVTKKQKRNFVPPFLTGNLLKKSTQKILKPIQSNPIASTQKSSSSKKNTGPTPSKKKKHENVKSRPSTSGTTSNIVTQMVSCSEDSIEDDDDDEKCCVCGNFQPEELHHCTGLFFTKWAKCDSCEHWTHLTYCTKVRVIRRGDVFRCPHCEIK